MRIGYVLDMQALRSGWVFLRELWNTWGPLMSGAFSVPFAALAVFSNSEYGTRIWGAMAYAALAGTAYMFWRRQARPELDIEFDPENIPECRLGNQLVMQFRMKVSNSRSGKTVRNCQGKVEFVERPTSVKGIGPYVEKVPLTWALQRDQDRTDLQDGQTLPLNVILVGLLAIGGQPVAQFIARPDANNAPHPFGAVGEYRCVVAVTSDDTRPKYVEFVFDWTGDPSTARIKNPVFSDKRLPT